MRLILAIQAEADPKRSQWNETASNNEGVLSLRYLSGTACPNSSAKRSSIIQLFVLLSRILLGALADIEQAMRHFLDSGLSTSRRSD